MEFSLTNYYSLQTSHAKEELQKCNQISEKYGLTLSEEQMELVIKNRFERRTIMMYTNNTTTNNLTNNNGGLVVQTTHR